MKRVIGINRGLIELNRDAGKEGTGHAAGDADFQGYLNPIRNGSEDREDREQDRETDAQTRGGDDAQ